MISTGAPSGLAERFVRACVRHEEWTSPTDENLREFFGFPMTAELCILVRHYTQLNWT